MEGSLRVVKREGGQGCGAGGWGVRWGGERADREGREEERKEEKKKAFVKCWWKSRKKITELETRSLGILVSAPFLTSSVTSALLPRRCSARGRGALCRPRVGEPRCPDIGFDILGWQPSRRHRDLLQKRMGLWHLGSLPGSLAGRGGSRRLPTPRR